MTKLVLALCIAAVAGAAAASLSTPGGLSREETPQFVLLTHDDAIVGATASGMNALSSGKSANGCPVVGTMFTLAQGTNCGLAKDLYEQGYEIAVHATQHKSFLALTKEEIEDQIVGGRDRISSDCGIPKGDIVGHRSTYLETKPEVREVLSEAGFEYDSTLIENTQGGSKSNGVSERIWPFDLGGGIATNCARYSSIQKCEAGESYPGLKEVPLWDLSAQGGVFTMDYGDDPDGSGISGGDVEGILLANFEESYGGNRAPFPLFLHTPYIQRNKAAVERFIDEVAGRPGVYFVTMRQLLAWMDNPIPLSQLTPEALGCGNTGGSPGSGEAAEPAEAAESAAEAAETAEVVAEDEETVGAPPPPPKKKKKAKKAKKALQQQQEEQYSEEA